MKFKNTSKKAAAAPAAAKKGKAGYHGNNSAEKSELVRITGLFESESGSSIGVYLKEDINIETGKGTISIPAGLRLLLVENKFPGKPNQARPSHVLLFSEVNEDAG